MLDIGEALIKALLERGSFVAIVGALLSIPIGMLIYALYIVAKRYGDLEDKIEQLNKDRIDSLGKSFETLAANNTILTALAELEKSRSRENQEFFSEVLVKLIETGKILQDFSGTYKLEESSGRADRIRWITDIFDQFREAREARSLIHKSIQENYINITDRLSDNDKSLQNNYTNIISKLSERGGRR